MLIYKGSLLRKITLPIGLFILIGVSLIVRTDLDKLSFTTILVLLPFYFLGFTLVTLKMYVVFEHSFLTEHLEIFFRDVQQVKKHYHDFSLIKLRHSKREGVGSEIGTSAASSYQLKLLGTGKEVDFDLAKYRPHGKKSKTNLKMAIEDARKISVATGLPIHYTNSVREHIDQYNLSMS